MKSKRAEKRLRRFIGANASDALLMEALASVFLPALARRLFTKNIGAMKVKIAFVLTSQPKIGIEGFRKPLRASRSVYVFTGGIIVPRHLN